MREIDIDNIISILAKSLLTKENSFEDLARNQSSRLTIQDLNYLRDKFHNPPPAHPETTNEQLRLGEWLAACQFAIFELVYNFDVQSLEFLKSIAFGEYDWTQATALEVICRLYINGIIPVAVINEIDHKLTDMRYETHLYLAKSLLQRMQSDDRFESIIKQIKNSDFHDALAEVSDN